MNAVINVIFDVVSVLFGLVFLGMVQNSRELD
jgi:hypothetical protein